MKASGREALNPCQQHQTGTLMFPFDLANREICFKCVSGSRPLREVNDRARGFLHISQNDRVDRRRPCIIGANS